MARHNRLRVRPMALDSGTIEAVLAALGEPALIMRGGIILHANQAAKALLGAGIERSDVRLAIRNPKALSHILPGKNGDVDVTGIGGFGRPWTVSVRNLGSDRVLVRFVDKSASAAAEKMRVDFVANASHELRTPLTAIVGYAETLADDEDIDRAMRVKFGQTIRGEARRMLRIIEDLMSLSRIEADRFVNPEGTVAIGEVAMSAAEQLQQAAIAAGSEIIVELDPNLPLVPGDHAQIQQLFDNLMSNAVRYGQGLDGRPIRVAVKALDESVCITVSDSGPGIAAEHLPRLTERFYRVDAARSRVTGGTGLGLAIVKHIVERHRGTLQFSSKLGKGTTVMVTLPVARPAS